MRTNDYTASPELLEYHIRAQYLAALSLDDETTLQERREARLLVAKLALLRHETYAQTLADILEN